MLEEIIHQVQDRYGVQLTPQRQEQFTRFLRRQHRTHPDYDWKGHPERYANLLADKLFIFAILSRQHRVVSYPNYEKGTLVDDVQKLRLLKQQMGDRETWDDHNLYRLFRRRNPSGRQVVQSYIDLITEVGADPEVVRIWRRPVVYRQDIMYREQNGALWKKMGYV